MFNLLSNAIKFTPAGGRIRVWRRRADDGTTEIGVSDNGIGIALGLHELIFQAYQRAPNVEIRRIEGSGLGLALVRTMMAQHGGHVRLDSAPGLGSTFTLVFPAPRHARPDAPPYSRRRIPASQDPYSGRLDRPDARPLTGKSNWPAL